MITVIYPSKLQHRALNHGTEKNDVRALLGTTPRTSHVAVPVVPVFVPTKFLKRSLTCHIGDVLAQPRSMFYNVGVNLRDIRISQADRALAPDHIP